MELVATMSLSTGRPICLASKPAGEGGSKAGLAGESVGGSEGWR